MYYEVNLIKSLKHMIFYPYFREWFLIVKDILKHDEFQRRKLFHHHINCSVWDHSIEVSYGSFMLAKRLNADEKICAIAGLLHDFYEDAYIYSKELADLDYKYVKNTSKKKSFFKKHGFTHGAQAAKNYVKYFPELENEIITDSIKNHMFPLTYKRPKYKEGWILTLIDKRNSICEVMNLKAYYKVFLKKRAN